MHVAWSGDNTNIMVTTNSAPRVDVMVEYAELFKAYFEIVGNAKIPPKFHAESLIAEHRDHGPIFPPGASVREQADLWAGHIRTAAVKYRDLKTSSSKRAIVERAATIISHHHFQCQNGHAGKTISQLSNLPTLHNNIVLMHVHLYLHWM